VSKAMRRRRRAGLYLITLLGCLSIIFFSAQTTAYTQCGIDWVCQTVDSNGYVGSHTSLAFGSGPAISYHDATGNGNDMKLKLAYDRNNDGDFSDTGEVATVDSDGYVGMYTSLAFGTGPAISYFEKANGDLKLAYDRNNNGYFQGVGEITTVDSTGVVGEYTSLAFGSGPAVSYYDFTNGALKLAYDRNDDGDFTTDEVITVDSAGDVGLHTSLAFGASGKPAISYYDRSNGNLKFAYDGNNDGDFADAGEIITVDSGGDVGEYTSLAIDALGKPAISYYDRSNGNLKFAYDGNNDGDFADAGEIITVDSGGDVGEYTSLAFGSGPAISYYDRSNGNLKFAYDGNNDGDFADAGEIITVDSGGDVGEYTSLAFGSGPAISYYDRSNGNLKFAYNGNNDGDFTDAGEIITVDSAGYVGGHTSLAIDALGKPAISYYNFTNTDLKFARYLPPEQPPPLHTWVFYTAGFFPNHLPDSYTGEVVLADLYSADPDADIWDQVQGVWWWDDAALEWKFWVAGVGGDLGMLTGHNDYMVLVSGACDWEISLP
jgi:hypothetical protein